MVLLYRISKTKRVKELTGEGARRSGGRWNLKGVPVLYTSDSTALAALEKLVHVPLRLLPKNLSVLTLELPDHLPVTKIEAEELPDNWHEYPTSSKLTNISQEWINQQATVALCVPSAIIPGAEGRNYILNPNHPDFDQVRIVKTALFDYDQRLFVQEKKI